MTTLTQQQQLVRQALELKKSWILAAVMAGDIPGIAGIIPDYSVCTKANLRMEVAHLEYASLKVLENTLKHPRHGLRPQAISWFADRYDQWKEQGYGLFSLSTALEFEKHVGELQARSHLEIPPYAELLIQPGIDVAFRHPEYHLARDLEFLFDLYRDAERLLKRIDWSHRPEWADRASENNLGLARTTILACFNLLESFVSGVARAHSMLHPELDDSAATKLLETASPLRTRIVSVPRQILGRDPQLDLNKPPLSLMFGDLKQYRDSFVHCEPGTQASRYGYVKEQLFHDVTPKLVDEAVSTTESVIHLVWKTTHGTEGPKWLYSYDSISGQSHRRGLTLIPVPPKLVPS